MAAVWWVQESVREEKAQLCGLQLPPPPPMSLVLYLSLSLSLFLSRPSLLCTALDLCWLTVQSTCAIFPGRFVSLLIDKKIRRRNMLQKTN
jgi:hypothetical protein